FILSVSFFLNSSYTVSLSTLSLHDALPISMNSYTDSIVHEQISFEIIDDGVRVNYKFGSNKKSADDLPLMLSVERYEALTGQMEDRKSTRLNSSHVSISYAVFCFKIKT